VVVVISLGDAGSISNFSSICWISVSISGTGRFGEGIADAGIAGATSGGGEDSRRSSFRSRGCSFFD
jgi:hypothetical protein